MSIAHALLKSTTEGLKLKVIKICKGGINSWILSEDVVLVIQYKVYLVKQVISLVDTVQGMGLDPLIERMRANQSTAFF